MPRRATPATAPPPARLRFDPAGRLKILSELLGVPLEHGTETRVVLADASVSVDIDLRVRRVATDEERAGWLAMAQKALLKRPWLLVCTTEKDCGRCVTHALAVSRPDSTVELLFVCDLHVLPPWAHPSHVLGSVELPRILITAARDAREALRYENTSGSSL